MCVWMMPSNKDFFSFKQIFFLERNVKGERIFIRAFTLREIDKKLNHFLLIKRINEF